MGFWFGLCCGGRFKDEIYKSGGRGSEGKVIKGFVQYSIIYYLKFLFPT